MIFSIGVEMPKYEHECYGIVIPALCVNNYCCCTASMDIATIESSAIDAIYCILDTMLSDNVDIFTLSDRGVLQYRRDEDYRYCDKWIKIDVDLTMYLSKPRNLMIDNFIKSH